MKHYACIGALLLAACARPPPAPSLEEDLAAIEAFNRQYLGAINDENIDVLSALTTDGHVMLAPNRQPIVGKQANDEVNGAAFERFDFVEDWQPEETVVSGDLAFQRGKFKTVASPKAGGESRTVTGSFMRIYMRQENGEWRMVRDMFNSDGAATN